MRGDERWDSSVRSAFTEHGRALVSTHWVIPRAQSMEHGGYVLHRGGVRQRPVEWNENAALRIEVVRRSTQLCTPSVILSLMIACGCLYVRKRYGVAW